MTDHTDTIRPESYEALAVRLNNTRVASAETCEQAAAAIVVLLAERQQAIDERDAAEAQLAEETLATADLRARCEQAIDALRDAERALADAERIIESRSGEGSWIGSRILERVRAALLSLGEQP